jgi:hypothetical protein
MRAWWIVVVVVASCTDDPAPPGAPVTSFIERRELPLPSQSLSTASPCWEHRVLDIEPEIAGEQHDCAAWLQRSAEQIAVLPPCRDGASEPCWRNLSDVQRCPSPPHQLVDVAHYPPTGDPVLAVIECVVAPE